MKARRPTLTCRHIGIPSKPHAGQFRGKRGQHLTAFHFQPRMAYDSRNDKQGCGLGRRHSWRCIERCLASCVYDSEPSLSRTKRRSRDRSNRLFLLNFPQHIHSHELFNAGPLFSRPHARYLHTNQDLWTQNLDLFLAHPLGIGPALAFRRVRMVASVA